MASTYTGLGIQLMTTGEKAGTWGTLTNTNWNIAVEQIAGGYVADRYKWWSSNNNFSCK